jgi:glycosyltransferase involved in cell wall biosynthesis
MKILLDHPVPFFLAHGGVQVQVSQTKSALERIGIAVEHTRWWDSTQTGAVIHYFGRPHPFVIELAHSKGMKVVLAELLTEQGSRPRWKLQLQQFVTRGAMKALPAGLLASLRWESYRTADACVALTEWETHLMQSIFGAPREKVHIVPNGVDEVFLNSQSMPRGPWLVCTATITERKRVLELAQAAVQANAPLWVVGRPYSETDPYAVRFVEFARKHPEIIRYEGAVNKPGSLARIYREARGFVLLSAMESLSLSALEAAACECPLLLSDLPWARTVFDVKANYCPITHSTDRTAEFLRRFYDAAPHLKPPPKPMTWIEVATQLKAIYETVLNTSR